MIDYESYKKNLDVIDKNDLENLHVHKKAVYCGSLNKLKRNVFNEVAESTPTLASAVIGLNNTAVTEQEIPANLDLWTEHDAQERFLNSKPTCYLIVSKPGSGAYSLGEAISKKYNCIHLCPKNVLMDEIDQGSTTGKCIIFNMKHNKVITINIIMAIMKKKMESAVVKHRGYVVSGLPLVTSDIRPHYVTETFNSEEALHVIDDLLFDTIANLKKKKRKEPKTGSVTSISSDVGALKGEEEEEVEEELEEEHVEEEAEEQPVELPKLLLDRCDNIIVSEKPQMFPQKQILQEQLNEIFSLSMHPDIIIYLTCPDKDLVTKKSHKYLNYSNSMHTFDNFVTYTPPDLRWPSKYTLSDYVSPYDSHVFNPKYNCKHPINFENNSINQICNYKLHVLQFVEDQLKDFDPKQIIKLNAHNSIHEMMYHLIERLAFLPVTPVLIPEPLYIEDPPEDMESFWSLIAETNVIKSGTLDFKRYPSLWFNRCPIELQKRRAVQGLPKFAISLFKHVYLLSSLNNFVSFYKNPRPYLKLKYLEPTCRIIVTGTKSSGKTMLSKCLSWLFDAPVISYDFFLQNERQKKYDIYSKTILSEIIPTIEDARLLAWQNMESERLVNLDNWLLKVSKILKSYVPILIEFLKLSQREIVTESMEEEQLEKSESEIALLEKYESLQTSISFLPFLDDVDKCLKVLQEDTLITFAPVDLKTITKKPDIPVLGDEDVTKAIENYIITNELQKEIEPSFEEIMTELNSIIQKIDEESLQKYNCFGKYIVDGFPSEPELWDYFGDANLWPDNVVALMENREIESYLIESYKTIENCMKNYQERFILANDPLIITKLRTTTLLDTTYIDIEIIVHELVITVLNTIFTEEDTVKEADISPETDIITTFTSTVEKFREDWDSVKLKLEENYKSFIEVELESKTDIEVIEDALLNLRKSYCLICEVVDDEQPEPADEEDDSRKDMLTYNDPRNLCETLTYCPITYFDHGVLWEGKPEFTIKHNNKIHYFSKEECLELFQKDVTRYQGYNKPFKYLPPLRLCIVGCIGSGKTTISKLIAKELGLTYIEFSEIINLFLIPKHFKKVGRRYENIFTDTPIDEEGVTEFQIDEENENLISDILGNEIEIRRMVYNYFERGEPILSILMQRLLRKLWFDLPFKESGFVIDGYPRLPTDIDDMVACFCLPDLIIELEGNPEISLQRLSQKMYKSWKSQLNEAKFIAKKNVDSEKQKWMDFIIAQVVVKLILEDLLSDLLPNVDKEAENELATGSATIEPNLQEPTNIEISSIDIYNEMVQNYPPPVDQNEWEKPDEARERIDARIESIYEVEDEASRVPVPDERFDYLCEFHKPASKVPAFLNVVDIAGLVRGAAEGQGLGNAFLSHIKACDAIFNLCRAFDDEDVIHVDGDVNPVRDLETIGEELRLKDEEQLMQNIEKLDRAVNRGNDKKLKPEYDSLLKIKTILVDEKKHIRFGDWSAADIEILNKYLFLTSKPALYLVNLSEKDYVRKKNKWLPKLKEWIDKNDPGAPLIPFSGVLETKLLDMDPEERKAYLKEHNLSSALDKIIVQGYKALQLEYFFTAGPDEVKAWTIQKGTKAPQAAGRIHTDFEKGFIMAEVMHYKDFKEEGTEAACKAAGKYRQQGRNYVVEDGDIIFFKFNAGAGLKDAKKK